MQELPPLPKISSCAGPTPLSPSLHTTRELYWSPVQLVGYHISRSLINQWDADVIGLDSFTDYYDVQLKRDRSNELIKAGVILYRGDVCNRVLLSYLFQRYNFTDVVHMAAQAGVRHSLDQPSTYAHTNIQCFLALLDTLREFNVSVCVDLNILHSLWTKLCNTMESIGLNQHPPTPPHTHTHFIVYLQLQADYQY